MDDQAVGEVLGGELDNVIAALHGSEGVGCRVLGELDTTLALLKVNETDVAQDLAFLLCLFVQLSKVVIELGQLGHEFICSGDGLERSRHNVLYGQSGQVEVETSKATADGDLLER